MESCSDTIERKAIDISGRLGSFYDAKCDRLGNLSDIPGSQNQQFKQCSECRVLRGVQSNGVTNLLKEIKFEDEVLQSLLLTMINPRGTSSFIDYRQPINENTRFLYYLYKQREETLDVTARNVTEMVLLESDLNGPTHMITKIIWGFEILCVIQNPNDQSAKIVEQLLTNISDQLQRGDKPLELDDQEQSQITKLSEVAVFGSEFCIDNPNKSLLSVLDKIRNWQRYTDCHIPIFYTLHPLKWLYKNQQFNSIRCLSNEDKTYIAQIAPIITHLEYRFNELKSIFKSFPRGFLDFTFNKSLNDMPKQFSDLFNIYRELRGKLRDKLIKVRHGTCQSIEINSIIFEKRYVSLRKAAIDIFYNEVQQWWTQIKLIKKLDDGQITYINGFDILQHQSIYLTIHDIDEVLNNHFLSQYTSVILWYSSDQLTREKPDEWREIYQKLAAGRDQIPLIYVDFTHCHQKLDDFTVRRLPIKQPLEAKHNHPREEPSSKTEINVLLLGESGVGKSTFINAFVNYLVFDTLQQAEQSEPVVLIPVSFLTTIGPEFDEFTVNFGNVDENEDHEHQGHSVTQQCQSYVFDLNERLILRLIDSPGMGDTRGIAQDDKNIEHILTYVNNLSHLNAVCLLLKPNASQLNVFFRSCINQLFTYLTPIGYNNIIFCFTNSRATFFAPGDTGSLLRRMLKKEHADEILFEKSNTFCFDSESFRYLAAKKCGVTFGDFQKQECTNSWTSSVTESIRLLNYILTREQYHLNAYQSLRKAVLEISMLARPLMETLRLILYNWKSREVELLDKEIILSSNSVTVELCSNCAQSHIKNLQSLSMLEYEPVKHDTIHNCHCPYNERHFSIEFTVKHDVSSQRIDASVKELEDQFHRILFQCDTLIYYFQQKNLSNQVDPFQPILFRFLDEERHIAEVVKTNHNINERIKETLRSIKQIRQQNIEKLIKSNEKLSLNDVTKIIGQLKTIPIVKQQLKSIKKSRQSKMKANENKIKLPSNKNKRFSELINSLH